MLTNIYYYLCLISLTVITSNLVNFNIIIILKYFSQNFSVESLLWPLWSTETNLSGEQKCRPAEWHKLWKAPGTLDDYTSTPGTLLNQSDLRTGSSCYHDIIQAYYWMHNCYIVNHRFNPHCCHTLFDSLVCVAKVTSMIVTSPVDTFIKRSSSLVSKSILTR